MRTFCNLFTILIFIIIFFSSPFAEASDTVQKIVRANDFYTKKQYQKAIDLYESIILKGRQNGYLYYNLGNAYIRLGKTGPAILNYIRARKWIPQNENLEANLRFAIQQTKDKIELPPTSTLNTLFFWNNDLNQDELIKFSMILNSIFWALLALWIHFQSSSLALTRNIFFGLLVLSFLSIGVKIKNQSDLKTGVILAKKVEVKSGRAADAVTLFQLHEGALVQIVDSKDNWLRVRLNANQKGWLQQNTLGT